MSEHVTIANPNPPDPNAPTQAEVNQQLAAAPAEAVTAAMTAAAPSGTDQIVAAHETALANLNARVQQVEGVIGVVAPIAQTFAGLIPGIGPEVETGLGLVPTLVNSFNQLLAEVQAAFEGKVGGSIKPVALPAPPA
jgi:hypothetical protein